MTVGKEYANYFVSIGMICQDNERWQKWTWKKLLLLTIKQPKYSSWCSIFNNKWKVKMTGRPGRPVSKHDIQVEK